MDAVWKGQWEWWAGTDEEWLTIGPCDTKQSAIDEIIQDGAAEYLDDKKDPPVWINSFHVVEARQDPLRLSDWIDIDWILEKADENISNSDRVSCEYDDGPWFDATKDQENALKERLRKTCDEWQLEHGLKFHSTTFSQTRNRELIETDVLRNTE